MADEEKKGKEVLTDAQKAAKAFLKAKAKAVREKATAQKEFDDLKELRTKRQKNFVKQNRLWNLSKMMTFC